MRTHDDSALPEGVRGVSLFEALEREEFALPKHCANVRLSVGGGQVFVLAYEVLVEGEDLAKLGRAIARVAEGNLE